MADTEISKIKIEIREDRAAGLLRAALVTQGGPIELATISRSICENYPDVYAAWRAVLGLALNNCLDSLGIEHSPAFFIKPSSMN